MPDMVQIGNEIGNGMLFPLGKIRDYKTKETTPQNWDNLAKFIYAGVNGVDAGRGNSPRPRIMIHVDHGGDIPLTRWFFDKIRDYDIPYDTIGFSFYPWSHGTLPDLKANLEFAAAQYNTDVILVETGYQNRPGRYFKELPGPYPETPEGQKQWLEDVNAIVMSVANGRGKGVYWWEPGNNGARGFFDADGNTLPVFDVFHKYTRPIHRTDGQ
jgi:arabinogalactan endo-1,4-beta-galactosidase